MILNTQQYPTSSSGYTAQLQRNAQRVAAAEMLARINKPVGGPGVICPPLTPIKIQTNAGAYTQEIQKCHTYAPTTVNSCTGIFVNGISAGGMPSSKYTSDLVARLTVELPFNPDTRFDAYKPYQYPTVPSTIIFTSVTIPVPAVDTCLLTAPDISKPNPISSEPTGVTTVAAPGGYITVTWTPGNDRSIVSFNIYVNWQLVISNKTGTTATIGPFVAPATGTVQIEPVAANNWRGQRSAVATWSI